MVDSAFPDPNHHLWRNGRLWWIAFTVRRPCGKRRRMRFSLRTADLDVARRRRDRALAIFAETAGLELALRPGYPMTCPPDRGPAPRRAVGGARRTLRSRLTRATESASLPGAGAAATAS